MVANQRLAAHEETLSALSSQLTELATELAAARQAVAGQAATASTQLAALSLRMDGLRDSVAGVLTAARKELLPEAAELASSEASQRVERLLGSAGSLPERVAEAVRREMLGAGAGGSSSSSGAGGGDGGAAEEGGDAAAAGGPHFTFAKRMQVGGTPGWSAAPPPCCPVWQVVGPSVLTYRIA